MSVTLCCVLSPRRIRGCSVWSSTLTRTCPSTRSPSWRCTGARNATKCPLTSTPFQRPPIAACCKVHSTISDLLPIAKPDTRARPYICYQLKLVWKTALNPPPLWSLSSHSGLRAFSQRVGCFINPWLANALKVKTKLSSYTIWIYGFDTPWQFALYCILRGCKGNNAWQHFCIVSTSWNKTRENSSHFKVVDEQRLCLGAFPDA